MAAEPLGPGYGREHPPGFGQEGPAGMVEIVGVLVVAEQDDIDRPDCADAGSGEQHGGDQGAVVQAASRRISATQITSAAGECFRASCPRVTRKHLPPAAWRSVGASMSGPRSQYGLSLSL
jgi:hypothetical protein